MSNPGRLGGCGLGALHLVGAAQRGVLEGRRTFAVSPGGGAALA